MKFHFFRIQRGVQFNRQRWWWRHYNQRTRHCNAVSRQKSCWGRFRGNDRTAQGIIQWL